jgi:hypothetical protein
VIRRILLLDHPQETRFFVFMGVFGLVLAAIYWFLSYEVAGTILLFGFGAGAGLLGVGLYRSRPRAVAMGVERKAGDRSSAASQLDSGDGGDVSGGGAGGIDNPFETPLGRLPGETLAPLALGLGAALALTAVVFGPWLLVAGLVPLAWGGWTWYTAARDELRATARDELRATARDEVRATAVAGRAASPRDAADTTGDPA